MYRAEIRGFAALGLAAALMLSGCTDTGADPEASPEPTTTPNRWKAGEFTRDLDVCGAVSQATQDRLDVVRADDQPGSRTDECAWGRKNDGGDYTVLLTVRQRRYEPPPPRPTHTATQEARHEFERPPSWRFRSAVSAPGLGDQAKVARRYVPGNVLREVGAVVRVRNVLFIIEAESGGVVAESFTDITEKDTRTAGFARLEEGVYATARDVVAKAGGRVPAGPATASSGDGEVAKVKDVCGTKAATSRLIENLEPRDIAQVGGDRSRSCVWDGEDMSPELSIEVEAVAPSPFTGEPAGRVAESIVFEGEPLRESIPAGEGGLGDGAVFAYDEFEHGENHDVGVTVRRGNLLLHVAYEQWFDPPQPKRPAWMKEGVQAVAGEVLDANR